MKQFIGAIFKTIGTLLALLLAAILFFAVQTKLRETQGRHDAAPATGRFVQAGDVEMFIQEMGPADGQAILFIHGTGAWSGLWLQTMTPLAEAGYHCIALDIPPFGFSEKPSTPTFGNADQARRIITLMDALEVKHAILVGHSFGGGATVETALMIPDRIDALILLDVGGLNLNVQTQTVDQSSALAFFLNTPMIRNPVLASTATNPLLTKPLISSMVLNPAAITDERVKILQQPLTLIGATDALGNWLAYVLTHQDPSLTSIPAHYQNLTMPTLIVWGNSDKVIPLSEGQYLSSIIPNSQFVTMQGVNHIPHLEDFNTFIQIVTDFLSQLPKKK